MRTGNGLLPSLISDTTYAIAFSEALENVKDVSANAGVVAQNLEVLSNKMNSGDNAVGMLLSDSTFAERLRNTMINTEHATEKLDENMEAMQHNFLLRRYFKKQNKKKQNEAASSKASASLD
jgi:phospholipid/cholesterol/gamma-HCH transport system substrate-binding protein